MVCQPHMTIQSQKFNQLVSDKPFRMGNDFEDVLIDEVKEEPEIDQLYEDFINNDIAFRADDTIENYK